MTQGSDGNKVAKVLVKVDPDLADLIPGFLENRRKDITAMLAALDRGDFETVRILGHSMKGAGGGYGFNAVTEIGAALEQAAKNQDRGTVRALVDGLGAYLDRLEVVCE